MSYLSDLAKQKNTTSPTGSYISKFTQSKKSSKDLSTLEGMTARAQDFGLGKEAAQITETTPRLSFLQRIGSGLGAFNPAEAILTGVEKGAVEGVKKYATGIVKGIGGAITGRDYEQGQRRYFGDVAEELGVKNGIAKFGIGFVGDILLDPSTYFGGAIAKGFVKAAGAGSNVALKTVGKVAPEVETGLRMAGSGVQDAFGRAFVAGYKASKGASESLLSSMSKKSRELAEVVSDQMGDLGVAGLSKEQRLEVGIKAGLGKQSEFLLGEKIGGETGRLQATKMLEEAKTTGDFSKIKAVDEELAKNLNVKFDNPLQQKYFETQQTRIKEFAKMADVTDPYAVYFPFIRKDKMNKFIVDLKRKGIQVGSEGYTKEFKNLLKLENIELDPRKAFGTVESQIVANKNARETLQSFVDDFGKPVDAFKNADEARNAGYRLLKEKGGFGKEVGWVQEWDAKLFNDLITPEFQTVNMLAKATGFDAVTSLFKRSVTGLFLPFHVRNFVSGIVQNYEVFGSASLNPKNIMVGFKMAKKIAKGESFLDEAIEIGGKSVSGKEVMEKFINRFGYGDSTFIEDMSKMFDDGALPMMDSKVFSVERGKETLKTLGLGREAIPFKASRNVSQFIEMQQKATAYITALGQGKSIEEALDLATRAGFDYRVLTGFESQILRRIIPFYSFTRKNIELQLKTMGENPQRINQVLKFFENLGEKPTEEERKDLPSYVKESLAIKLGKNAEGLAQFITGFGTPIEQFANLFRGGTEQTFQKRFEGLMYGQLSSFNPLIKAPIEIGLGKDSFRQRDLKDVYDAKEYSSSPQFIKDLLDIKPVQKAVLERDSKGNLKKVGERTQYIADPVRLLIARSLFTSRGASYLDQIFDGDLKGLTKILKLSTGLKPQAIDIEMQKSIKQRDLEREMQDLLTKYGAASSYSKIYVPKND